SVAAWPTRRTPTSRRRRRSAGSSATRSPSATPRCPTPPESSASCSSPRISTPTTRRSRGRARYAGASWPRSTLRSWTPSTRATPRWRSPPPSPTRTAGRGRSNRACTSRTWRGASPVVEWQFTLLLLSNGVLIGLMYALIALGFVLVYKATDAVNFAQGEFVMIAGFLVAGGLAVWGVSLWVAIPLALLSMVVFGFVLERVMLRKLIGRPVIAVVMATIGLASILRGIGPFTIFSGTKPLPLPVSDEPFVLGPLFIPPIQLAGGLISLAFLAGFGC